MRQARETVDVERMYRCTLAADYKQGELEENRALILKWNPGGQYGRTQVTVLLPGKSITVPKGRAFGWFGPFHVVEEFEHEKDPRKIDRLVQFWKEEKARILLLYGYPMKAEGYRPDLTPIAPHRFPPISITPLNEDGTEGAVINLHRIYEIGAFDQNWPLDSFVKKETPEEVRAQMQAELGRVSATYEAEARALRLQMAEVLGMAKVMATNSGAAPAASESAPVPAEAASG